MGMTIDEAVDRLEDLHFEQDNWEYGELTEDCLLNREALRLAIDTMSKYQQLQAAYEARLNADMGAMLEEIKEQLREMHEDFFETEHFDEAYGVSDSMDVIQQKINALRGEK